MVWAPRRGSSHIPPASRGNCPSRYTFWGCEPGLAWAMVKGWVAKTHANSPGALRTASCGSVRCWYACEMHSTLIGAIKDEPPRDGARSAAGRRHTLSYLPVVQSPPRSSPSVGCYGARRCCLHEPCPRSPAQQRRQGRTGRHSPAPTRRSWRSGWPAAASPWTAMARGLPSLWISCGACPGRPRSETICLTRQPKWQPAVPSTSRCWALRRREEVEAGETQLFLESGRPLREVSCLAVGHWPGGLPCC